MNRNTISLMAFLLLLSLPFGGPTTLCAEESQASYPLSAWPFVYHQTQKDRGETDVLWPFYRHEWRGTWERYAIRPLIYSTESDPSQDFTKTSVLWPLNIYERSGDKIAMNLTLYWYRNDPDHSYNIFFPVYWDGRGKDYSYFHLWPLYGEEHRASYTEYSTLYPFFRYGEDPGKDEVNLDLFWPFLNYQASPDYVSHRALPLYWYEKGPDTTGGFVFPYYWRNTPAYRAKGVVPLWYSSRGEDLATDVVFPLYYNRETKDTQLQLAFPLYGRWKSAETSLRTFFPLYLDYRQKDFGLKVGLPVYLDYRDPPASFTTVFPFYYRAVNASLPSEFTYYFPVYGMYRVGETYRRNLLFMPLYSQYRDEATQLAGWDVLWPMLNYESGPDRQSMRVFPLFWYTRSPEVKMTMGLPFYFSYEGPGSSYFHIIPFYGVNRKGSSFEQRFVLGPLYIDTQDPSRDLSRQDIVFPIYSRLKEKDTNRSWLFPCYYHRAKPDSHITFASPCLLPPYYVTYHDPKESFSHLWPFYGHLQRGTYGEDSVLWPVVRFGHDPATGENLYTVTPLWQHRKTPESTSDQSLVLHSYRHDEKQDKTKSAFIWLGNEDVAVLTYEREQDLKLKTRFLWKVVSYERTGQDSEEFRFLWRLVRKSSTPQSDVLELNPFYYRETDAAKGSYWAILGGLIGRETLPDGQTRMRYLWGL